MGAHPCQQRGGLDGLGHVVHCARLQAAFSVGNDVERGHEDHRYLAGLWRGTQGRQHLVAVHLRHHHVKQDDVGHRLGVGDLQGPLPRVGHAHVVVRAQQLADDGQVFAVSSTTRTVLSRALSSVGKNMVGVLSGYHAENFLWCKCMLLPLQELTSFPWCGGRVAHRIHALPPQHLSGRGTPF